MSKIDYQALREKAEKATSGVWSLEYGESRFDCDDALIHREAAGYIPICRIEGVHPESGFDEDFQMEQQANAEFIAAANPATVLALLDERERNQQYIKRRDQENEDIALTVGKLRVELEEAKSKLNEQREYYEGVIADGSKHIAELEAREVQLPTRYDLRYGHPINADERQVMIPKENGSWLYLIDLEHALRVADIRIKGE
ncbi:ead/Ea22-like family protein [Escherichia coli]|uniref:ead/Ea22-like family protein n=1 Tax=Escherichia coli TaxID=562 RepID=UPI000B7D4E67|nr:ead/Ea22-like family protein [Escherichia coli]EIN5342041.1 ead/Ea22-like family protein [Escherichia coli]EMB3625947.1 ead/Ea22-like family protein [Escherichia coli]MBB7912664.1 ead/Ea22-like family protein [Escherichia coli]MDU3543104.1 ead/Ea22-like family protein [Escherichia coli]MDU3666052.1 ead/Ea22-like family protein [Escherichia coli]